MNNTDTGNSPTAAQVPATKSTPFKNAAAKLAQESYDLMTYEFLKEFDPPAALARLTQVITDSLLRYTNWPKIIPGESRSDAYALNPRTIGGYLGYWAAVNDELHSANPINEVSRWLILLEAFINCNEGNTESTKRRKNALTEAMKHCFHGILRDPKTTKDQWLKFVALSFTRKSLSEAESVFEHMIKILEVDQAVTLANHLFDEEVSKLSQDARNAASKYLWRAISLKDHMSGHPSTGHNHLARIRLLAPLFGISETLIKTNRDGPIKVAEVSRVHVEECEAQSKRFIAFAETINTLHANIVQAMKDNSLNDQISLFEYTGPEYDLKDCTLLAVNFKTKYGHKALRYQSRSEQENAVTAGMLELNALMDPILRQQIVQVELVDVRVEAAYHDYSPPPPDPATPKPVKKTYHSPFFLSASESAQVEPK